MHTQNKTDRPVSIIVAAYNAENYLKKCLESLTEQSIQNLEIIVVDDGSTDRSADILEDSAKKDNRITVLRQSHKGVSAARNNGIVHSAGEYLLFCDADDFVKPDYVKKLLLAIPGYDLAVCGFCRINCGTRDVIYKDGGELTREELYEQAFCSNVIGGCCWNKLFRGDVIREENLCFDEHIHMGEDMLFCSSYFRYCRKTVYVGEALYCYCFHPESVMKAGLYDRRPFDIGKLTCLDAAERLAMEAAGENDRIKDCISYRQVRSAIWLLFQMATGRYRDRMIWDRMKTLVRRNLSGYRRLGYAAELEKLAALGLCVMPKAVWLAAVQADKLAGKRLRGYLK